MRKGLTLTNFAKADTRTQWFQGKYPGSNLRLSAATAVLCIHTTEGTSWPSYNGGSSAPHYTFQPPVGSRKAVWRAHFPDEKSSRALRNLSGGVETNTLNTIQVELIGTCDPSKAKTWGSRKAGRDYVYWPNASEAQLRAVARFVADLHKRHGLQLVMPKEFIAYPSSYGNSRVRMSFAEWRSAVGVVGHQHVPENSHGDPGSLNVRRILELARAEVQPAKPKQKTSLLKTLHHSMQFSDTNKQQRSDVRKIFARAKERKIAWVSGTEAGGKNNNLKKFLREEAEAHGYRLYAPGGQDCWIAVRRSLIKGGWSQNFTKVIPGEAGKHTAKGVVQVSFNTKKLGRITVLVGHWLTKGRSKDPRPAFSKNLAKNRQLAKATAKIARVEGKGKDLVFYAGDQNIVNKVEDPMLGAPFITCWDDAKKYPRTHVAGNIDVIARYKRDGRVSLKRARVWNDKKFPLHTDHFGVQANYTVKHI